MSQPLNEIQTPSHDRTFTPMATIPSLIIFPLFLYFALLAGRHIAIPGLYYDEVLFVNAATGGES